MLIFEDGLVSHLGGPNEQFGTHEKCPVGIPGYWSVASRC